MSQSNKKQDFSVALYIKQRLINRKKAEMAKGYEYMSKINLEIADSCLESDNQIQKKYEDNLVECD